MCQLPAVASYNSKWPIFTVLEKIQTGCVCVGGGGGRGGEGVWVGGGLWGYTFPEIPLIFLDLSFYLWLGNFGENKLSTLEILQNCMMTPATTPCCSRNFKVKNLEILHNCATPLSLEIWRSKTKIHLNSTRIQFWNTPPWKFRCYCTFS